MAFLFILMALLAFYGLLDAVAGIARAWRRANRVVERSREVPYLPLEAEIRRHPTNVKRIEAKRVVR